MGPNRYRYAASSPIDHVDISGLEPVFPPPAAEPVQMAPAPGLMQQRMMTPSYMPNARNSNWNTGRGSSAGIPSASPGVNFGDMAPANEREWYIKANWPKEYGAYKAKQWGLEHGTYDLPALPKASSGSSGQDQSSSKSGGGWLDSLKKAGTDLLYRLRCNAAYDDCLKNCIRYYRWAGYKNPERSCKWKCGGDGDRLNNCYRCGVYDYPSDFSYPGSSPPAPIVDPKNWTGC